MPYVSYITLPASSHSEGGIESVTAVQRPVVDDLWIVFSGHKGMSVDVQLYIGELHRDGVVVPLAIADLRAKRDIESE